MKRIFYFLLLITTIVVISCNGLLNDPPPSLENSQQTHQAQITVERAKTAFDGNQFNLSQFTRAQDDEDHSLMPGAFSVDWSGSVWSYDGRAESIESAISASRHFVACDGDKTVEVRQRLLSYMDDGDTAVRFYIATIIPSVEFYGAYTSDFADRFVQCDRQNRDFSGIVIYHTIDGLFCEIASFDHGQISVVYNAEQDYIIDDYENMVASVNFVLGDFHLHLNQSIVTRCDGNPNCPGGTCVEPVQFRICKWCRRRLLDDWQRCGCEKNGVYDQVSGVINWINTPDGPSVGGGGNLGPREERPCNDSQNGKANPLTEMKLAKTGNPTYALFGPNVRTYNGSAKKHDGVDFAAQPGTSVFAVSYGQIVKIVDDQVNRIRIGGEYVYPPGYRGDRGNYGNKIYIRRYDGCTDMYCHLQGGDPIATNPDTGRPFAEGDWVYPGDHIGYTGITGNAYPPAPPHLHFETRDAKGKPLDPFTKGLNVTLNRENGKYSISTPCDK